MFTDSDWGPKESVSRKSTSGRVALLAGGAVSWKTQKQGPVAESSAEAELISLAGGAKESLWLKRFLGELDLIPPDEPLQILVDNNACMQIANNRMLSERTKHLDIKYFAVRDHINKGLLAVNRVDTKDNTADMFTKPLSKNKFYQFRQDLGVCPPSL